MVSYAKFDKLARELDGESTNPTDGTWTKRRQDDFYLDPAVRDREAKTLCSCAPLGSMVELDGLGQAATSTTAGRGSWSRGGSARVKG